LVYFIRVSKGHVKIGFTTNLGRRLREFQSVIAGDITVLLTIPGNRDLEQRLHTLFHKHRIKNEIFESHLISRFVEVFNYKGLATAIQYIEDLSPARLQQRAVEERQRRVAAQRKTRAEENAHYAKLVAERKRTLGW
jgi:hypothetical protein